ncbi:MAG TPA: CocE/NonD family hydrolase [Caulobacteraceae bacterium]|nr:CocE/NonD family hydrolase [Caulobacteraceae bacterium]
MTAWRAPPPVAVREIENAWIAMPDGVRLAVSLWLPDIPERAPVVLEYIPYRKRDSTRAYARFWGRQLAAAGIGYARVDIRGSGDSGGLLTDEYLPLEQADAAQVIAWLAKQSWCNGAVGMRGVSWGGFATLQAAAAGPPALKAIMPMCASDRRFIDDAHYIGGSFALTGLKWATAFKTVMAGPPDPELFGDGWADEWRRRLEAAPPIAAQWLAHQREDPYWRQGSVGFDPGRIRCPVYLVGGWADPYNDTIPRLMERLTVPAKAVIGPWGHGYPAPAAPGPGLTWIDEETRWWRRWLLGEETRVMAGPRIWAFMPEASPAEALPGMIPGRWISELTWPPATTPLTLHLSDGRLSAEAAPPAEAKISSDVVVGLETPEWCPFSLAQYPQEQSSDDLRSLAFETDPLPSPLEIFGTPRLRLRLTASAPVAQIAARLTEVDADGRSWLVSYGALNLTHRESHAEPTPLQPDAFYEVELPLYVTARRFRAASRLRLALSGGLWPLLWPAPAPFTLTLALGHASFTLPVREPGDEPDFPMAMHPARPTREAIGPTIDRARTADGRARISEAAAPSENLIAETGTTIARDGANVEAEMRAGGSGSCRWRAWQSVRWRRDGWDCAVESEIEVTSDGDAFHVRERLAARQDGEPLFERETVSEVPRDLM